MKESRYFSCEEKGYIDYDYLRPEKVIAISKNVSKNNIS